MCFFTSALCSSGFWNIPGLSGILKNVVYTIYYVPVHQFGPKLVSIINGSILPIKKKKDQYWKISLSLMGHKLWPSFFFFFEKKLWPSWCNCGFRKLSFAQIMWILNCPICKVFYCQWASGLLTPHTLCRVCVCGSILQSPSHFCFFF